MRQMKIRIKPFLKKKDGDDKELNTFDIHTNVPVDKAISRSCLKFLLVTWTVNDDWFFHCKGMDF